MAVKHFRVSVIHKSSGYSASLFLTVWRRIICAVCLLVIQQEGHPHSKSQQLRAESSVALLIDSRWSEDNWP